MIDPFERSSIEIFSPTVPDPIDIEHFKQIQIPFNSHHVTEILDTHAEPNAYGVYVFREGQDLPLSIAEWLRYRSFDDQTIAANNADDRLRFRDIDCTRERFLRDRGGRRLYVAIGEDDGALYDATWLHPVQGDEEDYIMVTGCNAFLERHRSEFPDVRIENIATLATREYARAHGRGVSLAVQDIAVEQYCEDYTQCHGVVIRFASKDPSSQALIDNKDSMFAKHDFITIDQGPGFFVLLALSKGLTPDSFNFLSVEV